MLQISADKVAEIIILVREGERGRAEFASIMDRLDEDEQTSLVALMWIGRGTYEAEDLNEAIAMARQEATTPTADYLSGSPHLAEHLENGLEALGFDVRGTEDDLT